jgi:hypothetical protein
MLKLVLKNKIMKEIVGFIFLHLVVYLIGSFIAWDWNPLHWWIFTSSFGRILFLIFEMICFFNYLFED